MTVSRNPVSLALAGGVILLTLITAIIHMRFGLLGLQLFFLNGLGYLGLAALLYLPAPQLAPYRHIIRWVFVGYTALTVVLWVFIGRPYTGIGYVTKLVELALIALLVAEARAVRR